MQVTSANYSLSASHAQASHRREEVEIEVFRGGRRDATASATPAIERADERTAPTRTAQGAGEVDASPADDTELDPQLALLKTIIEELTGRLLKLFSADDITTDDAQAPRPEPAAARPPATDIQGLRMRSVHEYSEYESMDFRARGVVETADGQRIEFSLQLQMERSFVERSETEVIWGDVPELKDPLVINFDGRAADLTADRYAFDIDADGRQDQIPGLTPGRAFLVLDRNGNGRVDDGRELLGALSGDAYADLARLDSDGNGFVDGGDLRFSQLGLWRPGAEDNRIDALDSQAIGALSTRDIATEFKLADRDNTQLGQLRASSFYLTEDGRAGTTQQLDMLI